MASLASAVRQVTPVLVVDDVTPCAEFWEKLGFQGAVEAPHEKRLGFVILARDGVEVMYQSETSVQADNAELGSKLAARGSRVGLFVEVEDLEAAARAIHGARVFMPRRTTFYGVHEIGATDPGGHTIVLAQPAGS